MGERKQESSTPDLLDDYFEPGLGELSDELTENFAPLSSQKQQLVEKRRLAEQRLEERRLRDELGDYDLHLDDY